MSAEAQNGAQSTSQQTAHGQPMPRRREPKSSGRSRSPALALRPHERPFGKPQKPRRLEASRQRLARRSKNQAYALYRDRISTWLPTKAEWCEPAPGQPLADLDYAAEVARAWSRPADLLPKAGATLRCLALSSRLSLNEISIEHEESAASTNRNAVDLQRWPISEIRPAQHQSIFRYRVVGAGATAPEARFDAVAFSGRLRPEIGRAS